MAQTRGEAIATGKKTALCIKLIHEDRFTNSCSNSITRGQKKKTVFIAKRDVPYPVALPPSRRTKIFRSRINQGSGAAIIARQVQCLTSTGRSFSADTDDSIRTPRNRRIYNGYVSIESNWSLCAQCAPLPARLYHLRSAIRGCCLYQN